MRALSASDTAMAWLAGTVVTSLPRTTSALTGTTAKRTATARMIAAR